MSIGGGGGIHYTKLIHQYSAQKLFHSASSHIWTRSQTQTILLYSSNSLYLLEKAPFESINLDSGSNTQGVYCAHVLMWPYRSLR